MIRDGQVHLRLSVPCTVLSHPRLIRFPILSYITRIGLQAGVLSFGLVPVLAALYALRGAASCFAQDSCLQVLRHPGALALTVWALAEVAFYIWFLYNKSVLGRVDSSDSGKLSEVQQWELLNSCLEELTDLKTWLPGWFYRTDESKAPIARIKRYCRRIRSWLSVWRHGEVITPEMPAFEEIRRGNLLSWLAWAIMNQRIENASQVDIQKLKVMLDHVLKVSNVDLPDGCNPDISCFRLSHDTLRPLHWPLAFYLFLALMDRIFKMILLYHGFRHQEASTERIYSLPWYYYDPTGLLPGKSPAAPIVFIHGVSGVWPYSSLLIKMKALGRPIIVLELEHVSMHISTSVPNEAAILAAFDEILNAGFDKVYIASHSLGTGVTSSLLRHRSARIAGAVLCDPICFLLHNSAVARNFVYKTPVKASEHILSAFAARALSVTYFFQRRFIWHENIVFAGRLPDDIRSHIIVHLSMADSVVPSEAVYDYLIHHGIRAIRHDDAEHAQFLLNQSLQDDIVSSVRRICLETPQSGSDSLTTKNPSDKSPESSNGLAPLVTLDSASPLKHRVNSFGLHSFSDLD